MLSPKKRQRESNEKKTSGVKCVRGVMKNKGGEEHHQHPRLLGPSLRCIIFSGYDCGS